ncbi:MAG: hypothetical protein HC906_19520 [Bacteroidales bacterium]|nr:hypothetical protein [Bacteroidales bacterium]
MIENILIYKSPAPELPADFAGAVINIVTKNNADVNRLELGYSIGYAEGATFHDKFQTYEGGKYDWLGFDDGTRQIPEGIPADKDFQKLYNWPNLDIYRQKTDSITMFSKMFNTIWSSEQINPNPDQSGSITFQRRFVLGNVHW